MLSQANLVKKVIAVSLANSKSEFIGKLSIISKALQDFLRTSFRFLSSYTRTVEVKFLRTLLSWKSESAVWEDPV